MSSFNLNDKVAVITGGVGGIGKALSEKLLCHGAKVCVCDINFDQSSQFVLELEKKHGQGKALAVKLDVTDEEMFKDAFEQCKKTFGSTDIVINAAGIAGNKNYKQTIDINLLGVIQGTQLGIEAMKKENIKGVVINLGSAAGLFPIPQVPTYGASKAAVIQYSRNMGSEYHFSQHGIRVMCICPTFVDTPLGYDMLNAAVNEKAFNTMQKMYSKKETGSGNDLRAEDVADVILKLVQEGKNGEVALLSKETGLYDIPPTPETNNTLFSSVSA